MAGIRRRYEEELKQNAEAWATILIAAGRGGAVTLLYSAHDVEHNSALFLRDYLASKQMKLSAIPGAERRFMAISLTFVAGAHHPCGERWNIPWWNVLPAMRI